MDLLNKKVMIRLKKFGYLTKICYIVCIIALGPACAKNVMFSEDDWEGVHGGKLQVCISYEFAESLPKRDAVLLEAKQRAVVIIINYIRNNYPLLSDSSVLEQVIIDCFEKPLILYDYCDEIKCVALVSFDIKPVLEMLDGIVQ